MTVLLESLVRIDMQNKHSLLVCCLFLLLQGILDALLGNFSRSLLAEISQNMGLLRKSRKMRHTLYIKILNECGKIAAITYIFSMVVVSNQDCTNRDVASIGKITLLLGCLLKHALLKWTFLTQVVAITCSESTELYQCQTTGQTVYRTGGSQCQACHILLWKHLSHLAPYWNKWPTESL